MAQRPRHSFYRPERTDTNKLYRRKYFSPKERMHIAQQASNQMRKRQSIKSSWLAPPTPTSPVRPSTSAGTLSYSTSSLTSESKVSLIQPDQTVISEDQARWFLMLPDKVRKQHFSREEQVALMVRCKKVLEHVSPDMAADVYRRILSISREDRSPSLTKTRPSTSGETPFDEGKSYLSLDTPVDLSPTNDNWQMNVFSRYSRSDSQPPAAACTEEEMMALTSIPPPPPEPKESLTPVDKSRRKSFMRRHSLTPLPLPAPKLAPPVPPVPPLPSAEQVRHFALSAKQARTSTEQAPDLLEPPAEKKYYRDNDARNKLRNALGSEEKFDEALHFGFASDSERNNSASMDPASVPDQPLLYHSEQEDEDAKSTETVGPRTPTYIPDNQPAIKQPSFDSGVELPFTQIARPKTSGGSPAGSINNREMTIHMTLTRRDLQSPSPEEQLYSVQRFQNTGVAVEKIDPLALEPLTVSDDASGAHGAFAISEGGLPKGLKRVWKSLTRH